MARKNSTCSVSECPRELESQKYCRQHYRRWKSTGNPLRPCTTCGKDVIKLGSKMYCSPECKPKCRVERCDGDVRSKGLCSAHYARLRKGQELVNPCAACGEDCFGQSGFHEDCRPELCVVCNEHPPGTFANFAVACSGECYARLKAENIIPITAGGGGIVFAPPATEKPCVRCGAAIDLTVTGKAGRKKRADTLMCDRCHRARYTRHGVSINVLRNRDGDNCGICAKPIDMTSSFPAPQSPTVDHRIPFAIGGSHDMENLQLAHWSCNSTKQARVDWRPEAA